MVRVPIFLLALLFVRGYQRCCTVTCKEPGDLRSQLNYSNVQIVHLYARSVNMIHYALSWVRRVK